MTAEATTVIFTTRNRQNILRRAILAARQQTVPVRVIVMDDASTDGTERMMAAEFSAVEYHRVDSPVGPCHHRNRGIELARTPVVFSLDDDSILESPRTIEQTLGEFDDASVGAVAIPFINVLVSDTVHSQAPNSVEPYATHAFVAAAHALRRSACVTVGMYRSALYYMGEEGDLCIRLLEHGYYVRLGLADPIHHHQPATRVSQMADIYGRRNDLLFVYWNVPHPYLVPYLVGTSLKGLLFGCRVGRLHVMWQGLCTGLRDAWSSPAARHPVRRDTFKLYRRLKRFGAIPVRELAGLQRGPAETTPGFTRGARDGAGRS